MRIRITSMIVDSHLEVVKVTVFIVGLTCGDIRQYYVVYIPLPLKRRVNKA